MILCAWALRRMDFLPPCAQPDILTLCTLFHFKRLNRFLSRAVNRLHEWSRALVHWQGLGNLKNYLCAAWVSQTAFSDPSEKSTWNISFSFLSQGFRNSWGTQWGAAGKMGLCRPSWEDGDTCQLSKIQTPTVKLMYVECRFFFLSIRFLCISISAVLQGLWAILVMTFHFSLSSLFARLFPE